MNRSITIKNRPKERCPGCKRFVALTKNAKFVKHLKAKGKINRVSPEVCGWTGKSGNVVL